MAGMDENKAQSATLEVKDGPEVPAELKETKTKKHQDSNVPQHGCERNVSKPNVSQHTENIKLKDEKIVEGGAAAATLGGSVRQVPHSFKRPTGTQPESPHIPHVQLTSENTGLPFSRERRSSEDTDHRTNGQGAFGKTDLDQEDKEKKTNVRSDKGSHTSPTSSTIAEEECSFSASISELQNAESMQFSEPQKLVPVSSKSGEPGGKFDCSQEAAPAETIHITSVKHFQEISTSPLAQPDLPQDKLRSSSRIQEARPKAPEAYLPQQPLPTYPTMFPDEKACPSPSSDLLGPSFSTSLMDLEEAPVAPPSSNLSQTVPRRQPSPQYILLASSEPTSEVGDATAPASVQLQPHGQLSGNGQPLPADGHRDDGQRNPQATICEEGSYISCIGINLRNTDLQLDHSVCTILPECQLQGDEESPVEVHQYAQRPIPPRRDVMHPARREQRPHRPYPSQPPAVCAICHVRFPNHMVFFEACHMTVCNQCHWSLRECPVCGSESFAFNLLP